MSKKISPRVREQAAIYCSAMACWYMGNRRSLFPFDLHGKFNDIAYRVESSAFLRTQNVYVDTIVNRAILWAEAEALLRTGWEP